MSSIPLVVDGHELQIVDNVLVSIVSTTAAVPTLDYHVLTRVFSRCQGFAVEQGLTTAPWSIVHDFSAVADYDLRAFTAFTHFARWAGMNRRQRAAVIFPRAGDGNALLNVKRIVLNLIGQFEKIPDGALFIVDSRDAALAALCSPAP